MIPQNIKREHLLKAILEIDQNGVPKNAHSSTYDLVFEGKEYPLDNSDQIVPLISVG